MVELRRVLELAIKVNDNFTNKKEGLFGHELLVLVWVMAGVLPHALLEIGRIDVHCVVR